MPHQPIPRAGSDREEMAEENLPPTRFATQLDETALRDLIGRIVHQDQQAFVSLYEAVVGRVYGLALRITRDIPLAEEVTEEAFWQVWRQAPRFDPKRGSALAWILTIARSRALDAIRSHTRAEGKTAPESLAPAAASPRDDPLDLLAALQQENRLHAALAELGPQSRQLISLAFFQDLSHAEISCHTGLPLGTVKSHIRRALICLRQALAEDDPNTNSHDRKTANRRS